MNENEVYIGDGVYASHDGYQVKLRTRRNDGDHVIFAWKLRCVTKSF